MFLCKFYLLEQDMEEFPIVLTKSIPMVGNIQMKAEYYELKWVKMGFGRENCDATHIHRCYEIYANVEGEVSFFHNREICDVESGDIVLSYPSDVHYCIYGAPCLHKHYCVWFDNEILGQYLMRRGIRGRIRPSAESRERVLELLCSLAQKEQDPFEQTAHLMELLTLLDAGEKKVGKATFPDRLREILCYMDEHLVEIHGIHDVTKAFFLAESTLYRMFRNELGISFCQYLESQKMALAKRYLRANCSVTDACFLAGFTDCSRFIAKFKKKFGTTPLKYKKQEEER